MKNLILIIGLFLICGLANADQYTYLKGSQLVESNQSITSTGGTTQFDYLSPMKSVITGTLGHTINLPSTASIPVGYSYQILNKSTQSVIVQDFSSVLIATITPNSDKTFILFSGGLWHESSGGGSSGKTLIGSSPIVVTQDATTATFSFGTYNLDDVSNVAVSSATTNQHLAFDGSNWVPADLVISSGAVVTPTYVDNGGGSITVNAVTANLFNNDTFIAPAKTYTLAPITATLTDLTTSYIVGDYNSGTPIIKVITDVNLINESNVVPLLTIFRSGTYLHVLDWDSLGKGLTNKTHQSIVKTQRYRRESGLGLSEFGTRNVALTAGVVWVGANKASILNIDSTSASTSMFYFLRTGSSAWTTQTVTQYNNTDYFNGATTASLSNNRYAVNWIYRGVEQQRHLYTVLGEGDYTLAQAQASQPPSSLPANITSHAVLVGRIIVLKGASTATQIDSAFATVFTQSAASIHNDLSGLQGGTASEYFHNTSNQNSVMGDLSIASNTITASESLAVAQTFKAGAEYFQGTSKVDGSFGKDTSSWSASVGTIVRTANTEMQGNYVGVWSGTGAGTLDLLWTATASNTYELSAQIKLDVPSDYTLCGVVNGTETGCKVLSGYVANKIYKASVFADSVLGTSFYLRLKHTGAGAFSTTVDDGKIEPFTLNTSNAIEAQNSSLDYGTASSLLATTAGAAYLDVSKITTKGSSLYSITNVSTTTRLTALKKIDSINLEFSKIAPSGTTGRVDIYKNGSLVSVGTFSSANADASQAVFSGSLNVNDYLTFVASNAFASSSAVSLHVNAQATSDNVIVTSQDGTEPTQYPTVSTSGLGAVDFTGLKAWRDKAELVIKGTITTGTTDGYNNYIKLPWGLKTQSQVKITKVGDATRGTAGAASFPVLIPAGSVDYFVFSIQSSTLGGYNVTYGGSSVFGSSENVSFEARIPIAGWSSGPTVYSYNSRMEVFSANVAAAGTVTNATQNFVTSCTNATPSVCSLWSNFGVTPICWAHTTDITKRAEVSSNTATTATVARTDTGTAFNLFCHLK